LTAAIWFAAAAASIILATVVIRLMAAGALGALGVLAQLLFVRELKPELEPALILFLPAMEMIVLARRQIHKPAASLKPALN
jgi:hypothetical protein